MANPIQDKTKRSMKAAEDLYYRLVLLVGETGSGKTAILREIADDLDAEVININLVLSFELLDLTAKQRALRLPGILDSIIDKSKSTVVLDNLEILFDQHLKQDPLRLLQSISRNRLVLASWNGKIEGNKLKYAEKKHPEYRSYDSANMLFVSMDGTSTVDSPKKITGIGQA